MGGKIRSHSVSFLSPLYDRNLGFLVSFVFMLHFVLLQFSILLNRFLNLCDQEWDLFIHPVRVQTLQPSPL